MDITAQEMEATRIARWGRVEPYGETFIESRLPGMKKNLYKIINRGVLENRGVQPAIAGEHRFGVTFIEVPVGQGASLHAHRTEEVFCPLNGRMEVIWGDEGQHSVMLEQWDVISCPVGVMRGFRNPNNHALVIYSVVGGTDREVGRIRWHNDVLKAAEATGMAYGADGYLVQTGETMTR